MCIEGTVVGSVSTITTQHITSDTEHASASVEDVVTEGSKRCDLCAFVLYRLSAILQCTYVDGEMKVCHKCTVHVGGGGGATQSLHNTVWL